MSAVISSSAATQASEAKGSPLRRFGPWVLIALLAVLPFLPVPDFWIIQLIYIGLYALPVLGLVLLTGVAGLTSFG